MRIIYLRKDLGNLTRKVSLDMAYLVTNKKIRLRKELYEDGLYLIYTNNKSQGNPEKYFLTKDKIKKEDEFHYYFDFPFKADQIENISV